MTESKRHSEQFAVIREALGHIDPDYSWDQTVGPEASAALDSLEEQYAALERERDEWEQRYEELLSEVGGVWPG